MLSFSTQFFTHIPNRTYCACQLLSRTQAYSILCVQKTQGASTWTWQRNPIASKSTTTIHLMNGYCWQFHCELLLIHDQRLITQLQALGPNKELLAKKT